MRVPEARFPKKFHLETPMQFNDLWGVDWYFRWENVALNYFLGSLEREKWINPYIFVEAFPKIRQDF